MLIGFFLPTTFRAAVFSMKYPGLLLHGERSMSCAFLRSAPPNLRPAPGAPRLAAPDFARGLAQSLREMNAFMGSNATKLKVVKAFDAYGLRSYITEWTVGNPG